ncbi:MAG: hypothetical protein C0481_19970 [Phenylobacterium sp.]|nr:hypothetical protein [Phenylobacterium sp.]
MAATALSLVSTHALAAPVAGSRESELTCVGLIGAGLAGASAAQPAEPRAIAALSMAFGFYMGRASQLQPKASKQEVDTALNKLSTEEKNAQANLCLKQASELMGAAVK